jgi:hypothetical protein
VPIPKISDDELLLKGVNDRTQNYIMISLSLVTCCGICGTDGHIHDGEFIAKFPLIPGHEAIGKVVEMGKNVKGFEIGDRCVADVCSCVRLPGESFVRTTSHGFDSAVYVSIAVVGMSFSAKTLARRVSPRMVVLRNISNSKSILWQFYIHNLDRHVFTAHKRKYTRSTTSPMKTLPS